MKRPQTYDDGADKGFDALQKALSERDKLRAALTEAKAREIKVRWDGDEIFVGSIRFGSVYLDTHHYVGKDFHGNRISRDSDKTVVRAALESAALSALCEGGK